MLIRLEKLRKLPMLRMFTKLTRPRKLRKS